MRKDLVITRYCPTCLASGEIRVIEMCKDTFPIIWTCPNNHSVQLQDAFSWEDVQHIATVITIANTTKRVLKKIVDQVQKQKGRNDDEKMQAITQKERYRNTLQPKAVRKTGLV